MAKRLFITFLGRPRNRSHRNWQLVHTGTFLRISITWGGHAFCFYFPVVADYVTTAEAKADYEVVENFCNVRECRLNFHFVEIRESLPAIVRFTDYVLAHFGDYGYDPEDEHLRQRLRAIKQQCAEPGAAPNCIPAEPQRHSAVLAGPPSVN
jgi:hypothetical protein